MKKKGTLITISVILVLVLAFIIGLFLFQGKSIFAGKLEVSDLKIDHTIDWKNCYVTFTVINLYNSPVIVIGTKVNGVNYGYSNLTVPPGQTQAESLILQKLVITNSTNYNITITFTFNDGQYQAYSQSILPVRYVGSFFITDQSLTVASTNDTFYSITIQNTGNIPIVSANYTINNYQSSLPLEGNLMPKNTAAFNYQLLPRSCQAGMTYSITTQISYIDESISSAKSSVFAQAGETPTPTPTKLVTSSP